MLTQLLRTVQDPDAAERPASHEEGHEARDPFLTPEARVLALLEAHDGRVRQQDVVAETGYAEGTVSQLLSAMEADGQITRYWKDSGKVVAFPELGPDAATR